MASISELLAEQGRMLAEMRLRRGERSGALVSQLTQIPGQIMAGRQAERERQDVLARQAAADRRALAADERAASEAERRAAEDARRVKAEEDAQTRQEALERVLAEPGVLKDDGTVDRPLAFNVARRMGLPGLVPTVAKTVDDLSKAAPALIQHDPTKALRDPVTGREVVAAQPEAKPVTLGAPQPYIHPTRGRILARAGSDNRMYDVQGQPITDTLGPDVPPVRESTAANPLETQTEWAIPPGETEARLMTKEEIRQTGAKRPAGADKPSSGQQKRVLNFFNRAQQADTDLEAMEAQIQQMNLGGQAWQAVMPNFLQTELGQRYTQAQRAFTEARLRKDSGAAIPENEFESDRQTYFVQPGDSKETLEQKRRARGAMLASLGFESGQALAEFLGDAEEAKAVVEGYKTRAAGQGRAAPGGGPGRPREGDTKPIPGYPGTEQTYRNGKWIRTK